jgi:hypothetical protein
MTMWAANAGRKELHIRDNAIKASCACVKAKVGQATLPAGAKQPLRVYVGPKAELGPFQHSVYIPCDEPAGGKVLTIRGRVVGPGVADPPRLYFGVSGDGGREATKTFFHIGRYTDTEVTGATSDSPHVRCRLVRQRVGYAEFEASVTAWPTTGRLEGTMTITTTDPGRAEVQVPFSATVPRLIQAG